MGVIVVCTNSCIPLRRRKCSQAERRSASMDLQELQHCFAPTRNAASLWCAVGVPSETRVREQHMVIRAGPFFERSRCPRPKELRWNWSSPHSTKVAVEWWTLDSKGPLDLMSASSSYMILQEFSVWTASPLHPVQHQVTRGHGTAKVSIKVSIIIQSNLSVLQLW